MKCSRIVVSPGQRVLAMKDPRLDVQVKQWDERMADLSKHNGPAVGQHVPAHALDASRCAVAYPPEMLSRY